MMGGTGLKKSTILKTLRALVRNDVNCPDAPGALDELCEIGMNPETRIPKNFGSDRKIQDPEFIRILGLSFEKFRDPGYIEIQEQTQDPEKKHQNKTQDFFSGSRKKIANYNFRIPKKKIR